MLEAIQIGEKAKLPAVSTTIQNVVICGLGGSGIGGSLVSELLRNELKVPVIVNKGYKLPHFISASTLLILGSYSGNTEETLSCAADAIQIGAKPVCITSGGKLAEIAAKNNFGLITIPGGLPPRAALGYSLTQLFFILRHYGVIQTDNFKDGLTRSANFIQAEQAGISKAAEALASKLNKKNIILYSEDQYENISLRIKQQINENSKMLCWYNALPELNHNELVGWREAQANLAVIFLRSNEEYSRNTARILFTKNVIEKNSGNVHEIVAKGADTYEKHFYLIHFGDWLSYHLCIQQGYDPMEIDVLIALKEHMAGIK